VEGWLLPVWIGALGRNVLRNRAEVFRQAGEVAQPTRLLTSLTVRAADLQRDRGSLVRFLSQFLSPEADDRRFGWLYLRNPHGEAKGWLALRSGSDEIVGASFLFPRRVYLGGTEATASVLGDFCIHPDYRSLGPAVQLQRATLAGLAQNGQAAGYDFPNRGMLSVYTRLGIKSQEEMIRFAKPLRVKRQVEKRVKWRPLARALASGGDWMLRVTEGLQSREGGFGIGLHQGRCGEEFSKLSEGSPRSSGVRIARTAEYLNWRYREHPRRNYEIATARRGQQLEAYAVFSTSDDREQGYVVDLEAAAGSPAKDTLLLWVVRLLRERGALTVSAHLTSTHPWTEVFRKAGFRARESSPVMVYLSKHPGGNAFPGAQKWFLMDGDRES
jgi:GNAT superfamily N-acetyltransferase